MKSVQGTQAMKMLFAILIFMTSLTALSQDKDPFDGLNDKQKAELVLQIENIKEAKETSLVDNIPSPETLDKYAELGESIAKAAGAAAKELGMAADEFSQTSLGKVVIVLVAWKVMGADAMTITRDIIDIIVLVPVMLLWMGLWTYIYRRNFLIESVTWKTIEGHKKPKKQVKYHDIGSRSSDFRSSDFILCNFVFIAILIFPCFLMILKMVG